MRLILRSEKLMPFLQYQGSACFNDPGDFPQIVRPEIMIDRHSCRRRPEFGIKATFCNVNMRRFVAFFGIEIKLVAVDSQIRGHDAFSTDLSVGGRPLFNPLQQALCWAGPLQTRHSCGVHRVIIPFAPIPWTSFRVRFASVMTHHVKQDHGMGTHSDSLPFRVLRVFRGSLVPWPSAFGFSRLPGRCAAAPLSRSQTSRTQPKPEQTGVNRSKPE